MNFIYSFIVIWLSLAATPLIVRNDRIRHVLACAMMPLFALVLFLCGTSLLPWQRLMATTFGLLLVIKAIVLLRYSASDMRQFETLGLLLFMSIWPGMNAEPFRARVKTNEDGVKFARGFVVCIMGLFLFFATSLLVPALSPNVATWTAIAACLIAIHLGYADILTSLMRLGGWDVDPLFDRPLRSVSLRDFWSCRWNLAFSDMNRILLIKPLTKWVGAPIALFLVFLVSGLLHDACISYSAWGGWGMPLVYFLIQGTGAYLERRLKIEKFWTLPLRISWTWLWILLPLPLLFTHVFRHTFILPALNFAHAQIFSHSLYWYSDRALWLAGLGNFVTLAAGLQVPFRLKWMDELAKLSPFNRKIFLNYAIYVGLTIVSIGTLTFYLHDELLGTSRATNALCMLMGGFWGLRILVDFFWFKHQDWPRGPSFVIGHTCLTALFFSLTSTYLGLALWHLSGG